MKPALVLLLILCLVLPGTAVQARASDGTDGSCLTCLGPPLGVTSPDAYFPVDNFRKVRVSLRQYGLPEFLYMSIEDDDAGTLNAWPVVKALTQFGTLQGVQSVERSCHQVSAPNGASGQFCHVPTFDLSRAIYRSRYLRFVYGVAGTFVGTRFRRNSGLPASEATLFRRYACKPARFGCADPRVRVSDFLEVIGGYEQTSSQFLDRTVFQLPASAGSSIATFDQVHSALASGKESADGSYLVTYINGEANIMTALVCRSDGNQPVSVCKRPVIKTILRSVK